MKKNLLLIKLIVSVHLLLTQMLYSQCTFTKSGTWTSSGTSASTTIDGVNVSFNSTAVYGDTDINYTPNGTFNTNNFWSPSSVAGSTSLEFRYFWDTFPEEGYTAASDDAGVRNFTINFSRPVKEVKLHFDRIGGYTTDASGTYVYSNSAEFTFNTPNVTMTRVSGNNQFIVSGNTFYREPDAYLGTTDPGREANNTTGTASGTIAFSDTSGNGFTSLSFSVSGIGLEGPGSDEIEIITEVCTNTIFANNDGIFTGTAGTAFNTTSVFNNDKVNGITANSSNVSLSKVGTWPTGFTFNSNGTIAVANTVSAGTYNLTYKICSTTDPLVCDTAIATITINPNQTYNPPCSFTQSGTWSNSGSSASTTINGVDVTLNANALSGSTSISYTPNGIFNTNNFWNPSTIAGSNSLELRYVWDTTPENGFNPASDDAGVRNFTINFSRPIKEFKLHVDRIGGYTDDINNPGTFYSNSAEFSLTTPNITMTRISGNNQFLVTGNKFYREADAYLGNTTPDREANNTTGTGAGTIAFSDTTGNGFTSLNFSVTGIGVEGTGSDELELIMEICSNTISAIDDGSYNGVKGTTFTTPSIFNNDTVNGTTATSSNVSLSTSGTWPAGFTLNSNGTVTVSNTVNAGTYNLTYRICSTADSTVCDTAIITINITNPTCNAGNTAPVIN